MLFMRLRRNSDTTAKQPFNDGGNMERNRIETIALMLSEWNEKLKDLTAVAGFDGFVDIIARPIASGDSMNPKKYYENIREFSGFLSDRAGCSCSVELAQFDRKLGGNAPIFANALGRLGVSTTCIGAFGYPDTERVFKDISPNCHIIPVALPGTCTALEFTDGKVMLALNGEINEMTWELVSQRAGIDKLICEFKKAKLIGLFNWSETPMAGDIWNGIIQEILPHIDKDKQVIFDFSDCARHKKEEILGMLDIVTAFGRQLPSIISMNENEASAIRSAFDIGDDIQVLEYGDIIRKRLSAKYIVLHFHEYAMGFSEEGTYRFDTRIIGTPVISTGAGDNFNAGLCCGLLLGFTLMDAIVTASMTSSYYVAKGRSPDMSELIGFMHENAIRIGGSGS